MDRAITDIEGTHYRRTAHAKHFQLKTSYLDMQTGAMYEIWQVLEPLERYKVLIKSPIRMAMNDIRQDEINGALDIKWLEGYRTSNVGVEFELYDDAVMYCEEKIVRGRL